MWKPFAKDGRLANDDQKWVSSSERLAGAIAVRFTLRPGEKRIVPLVIAWDTPVAQFGSGRKWYRRYTDFYGTSGTNASSIARDALMNSDTWSDAIDRWQSPTVNDETKPLWYRGMLFNELYDLADGGSFWGRPVGSDPKAPRHFRLHGMFRLSLLFNARRFILRLHAADETLARNRQASLAPVRRNRSPRKSPKKYLGLEDGANK